MPRVSFRGLPSCRRHQVGHSTQANDFISGSTPLAASIQKPDNKRLQLAPAAMKFSKNYKLLEFLNRRHGWPMRHAFAICGWLGAMATTRSPLLALSLFNEFAHDQFDIACRKALRHARYLSPKLALFHDPFFDFTVDTSEPERRVLEKLLQRKKTTMRRGDYLTDLLYIRAADIHQRLEIKNNADAAADDFYRIANELLAEIRSISPSTNNISDTIPPKPANFDQQKASHALHDLIDLLPQHEWPWYVVSGTLLGLHREGGFLGHDLDMDVAFNNEDVEPARLLAQLSDSSQFCIKRVHHNYDIHKDADGHRTLDKTLALIQLVHKEGTQVDLFIYHLKDGKRWHGSVIHHWQNTPFKLCQRNLAGTTVYAPDNADLYLSECYGDWRTPHKAFDCNTDTPNLHVANNFASLALFLKQLSWSAQYDHTKTSTHLTILKRSGFITSKADRDSIVHKI